MFSSHTRIFKWDSLLLWGVGMYATLALVWRFLLLYGITTGLASRLVMLLVLVIVATLAGHSLRYAKALDILPYAIGWTLIAVALDKLIVFPIEGIAMYMDWNIWVGYILLLVIPLLAPHLRYQPDEPSIT
ncbi:hypothetical protein C4568_04855 [Candidatus Parcubacteria bacterium]|nr:MAG: hypothetical protein C4568_04855 [Candidatus Parcubacteria bacterium]